jgi:23S rRNA (adenine2503-C2)-methyltransferase
MEEIKNKKFDNGIVYLLKTKDNFPVEVTDTFLPFYTKDAIGRKQNCLSNYSLADRSERWMLGISCMSGCPVRCKFCATGKIKNYRNLTSKEMIEQIDFIINKNDHNPNDSKEFKINYTRMGEPFLNIEEIKKTIIEIDKRYNNVHHYISTIGIKNSDFSFVKNNITLQVSVHSLIEERRNNLIPYKNKMTIKELKEKYS